MNDDLPPTPSPRDTAAALGSPPVSPLPGSASFASIAPPRARVPQALWLAFVVLAVVAVAAIALAWRAEQRVRNTERELVKRQQESGVVVTESSLRAKEAQENAREAMAKAALLEARLNEVALQRTQLEALVQSVARSRDDALIVDSEAMLRAAMQQSAITGSAEPLVAALRQSEERLARADQPRLEPLRRAVARDLDRVKGQSVADVGTLAIQLDEAVRLVDGLPLVASNEPRRDVERVGAAASAASAARASSAAESAAWLTRTVGDAGMRVLSGAWDEVRSLVRITRIDRPEAMLVAPEQTFFLRENLKLRLLNARLSILARQFDSAQSDLQWVQGAIERYFDKGAKKTQVALEVVRKVAQQARAPIALRPDETLAALATLAAAR